MSRHSKILPGSFCFDFYYMELPRRLELPRINIFSIFCYYLETWPGIFRCVCYSRSVARCIISCYLGFQKGRYSFYGNHSSKSAFSTTRGPIQNSKRKHAWNVKIVIIKRKFLHKYVLDSSIFQAFLYR